jgi:hypothetical protein
VSRYGRPFTDEALTRVLGQWLSAGPEAAPDRLIEDVLRTVAATPQRRWRGRLLRMTLPPTSLAPVSVTVAAIGAVVLVAIGLGLRTPSPSGEATPIPGTPLVSAALPEGWEVRTFADAGYELALPAGWRDDPNNFVNEFVQPPISQRLAGFFRSPDGALVYRSLYIEFGDPSGNLLLDICGCPSSSGPVHSLDDMLAKYGFSDPLADGLSVEPVSLAGEEALLALNLRLNDRPSSWAGWAFVLAIHDSRPVVLWIDQYSASVDRSFLEKVISSFRFLP